MRVLHIVGTLALGGAERLVVDLALHQRAMGLDVAIATLDCVRGSETERTVWLERVRLLARAGIPTIVLGSSTRDLPGAVRGLTRIRQDFDVMHCHLLVGVLAARLATGRRGVIVWTLHATHMGFPNRLIRATQGGVDTYVGCSQAVSEAFQPFLKSPMETVENGIDLAEFRQIERASWRPPDAFRFVSVGALRASKNYPRLIEASRIAQEALRREGLSMQVYIAGEGEERQAIQDSIERNQVASFVALLGARADVDAIYRDSDAFVMASDVEGLPLSLLEAMASGLPCVLTPFAFASDALKHSGGALVSDDFSASSLASAMVRLVQDPGLAKSLGGGARNAVEEYDIRACADNYVAVYGRALAQRTVRLRPH
jgi:glycosyltransferase involved in cell wall biosynthesis